MSRQPCVNPNYDTILFFILYILYFDVRNLIIIFLCIKICNVPHRMEITTGKYDLIYPDKLGIDNTNKMLYWMTDKVIHKSDYDGNSHKIIKKSGYYDPNIPRCIYFTKATEYNFFWEKPRVSNRNRPFAPNLLSISYQKSGEVSITSSMDNHIVLHLGNVLKVIRKYTHQYLHLYSSDLGNVNRLNFDVLKKILAYDKFFYT
jgi:hypothetical protein